MDCLLLAWNPATLTAPVLSFTNALRTGCLERTDGADLFMAVGKVEGIFVENTRFDPAARHACLNIVGRAIDAMMTPFNRTQYDLQWIEGLSVVECNRHDM